MLNWFKRRCNIAKKTAGLSERKESVKNKIELANLIMCDGERRKADRRMDIDRRSIMFGNSRLA